MAVMASMPRFDRRFHFTGVENRSTVITFLMSEGLRIDSLVFVGTSRSVCCIVCCCRHQKHSHQVDVMDG